MLSIAWQYLSGTATAMEHAGSRAEWPPHPDRVFLALVASWGERGCDAAEKAALEWLEALPAPRFAVPDDGSVANSCLDAYVPVNDSASGVEGLHARKKRWFATTHVGDAVCALVWPEAEGTGHRAALESLCSNVTHVGHSRSLVRMWVEEHPPETRWQAVERGHRSDANFRVPHPGRLAHLVSAYAGGGEGWERPSAAPYQGYVRGSDDTRPLHGDFDPRLVVLRRVGGEGLPGLAQAPAFAAAMRSTLMRSSTHPLISGHLPDGSLVQTPHVACLPLGFIGNDHSDGHLLGMALALPCGLGADDELAVLNALADAANPETGELKLVAGNAGSLLLAEDDRPGQPMALRPYTWTRAATRWGSATPIVLDRMPPRRHRDTDAWAADQVAASCERQGLPRPVEIHILPVSPLQGAPACRAFPPLKRKPDGAPRWHVHARIRFADPVRGPLVLGAGRYRGYGLCKPMQDMEPTQ